MLYVRDGGINLLTYFDNLSIDTKKLDQNSLKRELEKDDISG